MTRKESGDGDGYGGIDGGGEGNRRENSIAFRVDSFEIMIMLI